MPNSKYTKKKESTRPKSVSDYSRNKRVGKPKPGKPVVTDRTVVNYTNKSGVKRTSDMYTVSRAVPKRGYSKSYVTSSSSAAAAGYANAKKIASKQKPGTMGTKTYNQKQGKVSRYSWDKKK